LFNAAVSLPGKVIDGIKQGIDDLIQIGKDMIDGIWQGIQDGIDYIIDNITAPIQDIVDKVKDVLGIHSPSTVFAEIGENLAQGLENGWNSSIANVTKNMKKDVVHLTSVAHELEMRKQARSRANMSWEERLRQERERIDANYIRAVETEKAIEEMRKIKPTKSAYDLWVGGNPIEWEDDGKWKVWEEYKAQKAEKAANNSATTTATSGVNRTANTTGSTASTQQPLDIYLQLDGMTLARYLLRYNEQAARLTGGSLIGVVNG